MRTKSLVSPTTQSGDLYNKMVEIACESNRLNEILHQNHFAVGLANQNAQLAADVDDILRLLTSVRDVAAEIVVKCVEYRSDPFRLKDQLLREPAIRDEGHLHSCSSNISATQTTASVRPGSPTRDSLVDSSSSTSSLPESDVGWYAHMLS